MSSGTYYRSRMLCRRMNGWLYDYRSIIRSDGFLRRNLLIKSRASFSICGGYNTVFLSICLTHTITFFIWFIFNFGMSY